MVYITGDIHGKLEPIYDLYQRFKLTAKDIVIILGDVGVNYYGGQKDLYMKQEMAEMNCTFFCIHGNHENRPQNIASYKEKEWCGGRVLCEDEFPNILFPVDGDIFELADKRCMVIGGAYSVDKYYRQYNGWHWWGDEQPSTVIKQYVERQISDNTVDIILSHTCPAKYIPTECFLPNIDQSLVDRSTEEWLDIIEEKTNYQAWYVGHWHTNKDIDKLHFLFHDVKFL